MTDWLIWKVAPTPGRKSGDGGVCHRGEKEKEISMCMKKPVNMICKMLICGELACRGLQKTDSFEMMPKELSDAKHVRTTSVTTLKTVESKVLRDDSMPSCLRWRAVMMSEQMVNSGIMFMQSTMSGAKHVREE